MSFKEWVKKNVTPPKIKKLPPQEENYEAVCNLKSGLEESLQDQFTIKARDYDFRPYAPDLELCHLETGKKIIVAVKGTKESFIPFGMTVDLMKIWEKAAAASMVFVAIAELDPLIKDMAESLDMIVVDTGNAQGDISELVADAVKQSINIQPK